MSIYSIYWSPGIRPGQQKITHHLPKYPQLVPMSWSMWTSLGHIYLQSLRPALVASPSWRVFYNFRVEVKGAELYRNYVRKSRLHWLTQPRTTWENFKTSNHKSKGWYLAVPQDGSCSGQSVVAVYNTVYGIHRYTVYMSKGQGWSFREQNPHLPSWHDTHCNPRCHMCGFSWPRA